MNKINSVLGISSLYERLPVNFVNGFKTVEQKFFNGNYVPLKKDTIVHLGLSLTSDDFVASLERQGIFRFVDEYNVRRLSFDIGPCFRHVQSIYEKYVGISGRLSLRQIFELCERKLDYLRQRLRGLCEIAVENLNYYDTSAYEYVCEPHFYNDICKRFDIGLVFDIAHAEISAYNQKVDLHDYIEKFDFDNIDEFHISKTSVIDKDHAVDSHNVPDEAEFGMLYEITKNSKKRYDMVIEYWKDAQGAIEADREMKEFFRCRD